MLHAAGSLSCTTTAEGLSSKAQPLVRMDRRIAVAEVPFSTHCYCASSRLDADAREQSFMKQLQLMQESSQDRQVLTNLSIRIRMSTQHIGYASRMIVHSCSDVQALAYFAMAAAFMHYAASCLRYSRTQWSQYRA
jgi:hypothetical protein